MDAVLGARRSEANLRPLKTFAASPPVVNVPLPSAPAKQKSPVPSQVRRPQPPLDPGLHSRSASSCTPRKHPQGSEASPKTGQRHPFGPVREGGSRQIGTEKPGKFGRPCDVNRV